MDVVDDMWAASLPTDLFLEIFLRLDHDAVICCAGVCKPWRRAIIGNASILGSHLDRLSGPSLFLGVFHYKERKACLWRMPGPFQSILRPNGGGGSGCGNNMPKAKSLVPAAASAALPRILSCKDGFILLAARSADSLCLCNPVTGHCTFVPAAAAAVAAKHSEYIYILLTAGISSSDDDNPAVQILAVHTKRGHSMISEADEETLVYQLLSTSGNRAGVWSPVLQCSSGRRLLVWMDHRWTAVGRHSVYWLAGPTHGEVTCALALDIRTGRTWTKELPVECRRHLWDIILSMSGDGRLTLIQSFSWASIKVWVQSDDDDDARWTNSRMIPIDMDKLLLPHCLPGSDCHRSGIPRLISMGAFCPQSKCVVVLWSDQEFLIDIESGGSHPGVTRISYQHGRYYCWPYELDSSTTYISKMKHF